ncbi:MAG: SDR family oxidoreductase [Phycisphaerales bacterium]|nr:SDR family oxidoreductase [Phycisphaerales bacterium]
MSEELRKYQNRLVLVTGGGGFIGSHLVRGLLDQGADVRVLDNFSHGSRANLTEVASKIEIMEGDITSWPDCRRAVDGCAMVFHLAALGSVPGSVDDAMGYNSVNINGTLQVLDACRKAGVRRVVYSASSAAYGDSPLLPKTEDMMPSPKSPYAVGKLAGEYYLRVYAAVYGLSGVSLRYFNVFGPRQNSKSQYAAVIPAFASAILSGQPVTIYGDGEQTRDFCHVYNVVLANLLAGSSDRDLQGEVVNVACGQNISLNVMLGLMEKQLGHKVRRQYLPARAGDVRDSLADIGEAQHLLAYKPAKNFEQGLAETMMWYKDR